ncbi:hypothetical protein EYF80_027504 [Liparis tanakae]|uniref:Uncharacterized protein n=1 Tax=Liparis tanakae TaxID=230148 RepID=A0A4Z2H9Q2_9TELE|nr:hypothetical protein EYF80_027504 [Liparis tanakae]
MSNVLDWHKANERESWKYSQSTNEKIPSYQLTFMCFLFSLHINWHVCSLPLCRFPKLYSEAEQK